MATVVVAFGVQPPAAGVVVAQIQAQLTDALGEIQSQTVTDPTVLQVSFTVAAPGPVTALVSALAADGSVIGSATGTGVVPGPAPLGVPQTVTVTVS